MVGDEADDLGHASGDFARPRVNGGRQDRDPADPPFAGAAKTGVAGPTLVTPWPRSLSIARIFP